MKRKIRLTENELHNLIENTVRRIIKENYDGSLYRIVDITPQNNYSKEDEDDYDKVCEMYDNGDINGILDYMAQWDYGEGGENVDSIDEYENIIYEDDNYILTVCPSKHFGWQGDAFFLYGKQQNF